MAQLNKDKYDTLKEARAAYRKWQDGCTQLHWCVLPFDEWLYDRDRSAEMALALANAEEGEVMEYLYQLLKANSIDFHAYKQTLLENLERFKWLKFQLDTGRPTSRTCHDWNCTRSCISRPLSEFEKEYKTVVKLPFEYETDVLGKKVEGWPSDKVALERCEKAMRGVSEWAERAARVLTDTRFFAEKKHDKVLPPRNKMKG